MQDVKTEPNKTNVESIVKVDLTAKEWATIKVLRQIRFGQLTVYKQSGTIIRIEPTVSIVVKEDMDTNLLIGVE